MLKLKTYETCGQCPNCMRAPIFAGQYYCNMKASDPKYRQMDISTCKIDLDCKPDDCPMDSVSGFVESLNPEDQLGLKCISKMFGGGSNTLFEEDKIQPTIGNWIKTDEMLPKERDWYLGIFQETDTGWINPVPFICDYLLGDHTAYTTKEGWIIKSCTDNDNLEEYFLNLHCVAWMPLPKTYEEINQNGSKI